MWAHAEEDFDRAIKTENVDEAARLWSLMAELWLYTAQEGDPQMEKFYAKDIPRRGETLPFQQQDLVKKMHKSNDSGELGFEEKAKNTLARIY